MLFEILRFAQDDKSLFCVFCILRTGGDACPYACRGDSLIARPIVILSRKAKNLVSPILRFMLLRFFTSFRMTSLYFVFFVFYAFEILRFAQDDKF